MGVSNIPKEGLDSGKHRASPLTNIRTGVYFHKIYLCVLCLVLWKSQSCSSCLDESLEVSSKLISAC